MPDTADRIHPTAIIEGTVELADDVIVGPGCVIRGDVTIGAGTKLIGQVWIEGPATIGASNLIYPFSSIGFAPQSRAYDPAKPGHGIVIGDHNILRECFTMHRAMTDDGPTRLGDHGFLMSSAHIGHDCQVGSWMTMATGAVLAGHVTVGDRVTLGGGAGVHQFTHVGRGSMLAGHATALQGILPWHSVVERSNAVGLNRVGLKRNGIVGEERETISWIYRTINREGLSFAKAIARLRERADEPAVAEALTVIDGTRGGICTENARTRRERRTQSTGES